MTSDNDMYNLTEMEIDVIGEVMNISMGAAATAMSTILDRKGRHYDAEDPDDSGQRFRILPTWNR